jgi:ferredoxin--NADP+ reductase/benzoate/toluate 1,2-dioxygenase reductase subunit
LKAAAVAGDPEPRRRVRSIRAVSPTAYVLRFDRDGLSFRPGQYIHLGRQGRIDRREYSLYSPPDRDYLEVLIKEVEGGLVSRDLKCCRPGEPLALAGPFGSFLIREEDRPAGRFLFVATGTGIAPFHCFVQSYPGLDYTLLHGVRTTREGYDWRVFERRRLVTCVSREADGDFRGRVTAYLRAHSPAPQTLCYLCGNSDMIYETLAILRDDGVPAERIFAEIYF